MANINVGGSHVFASEAWISQKNKIIEHLSIFGEESLIASAQLFWHLVFFSRGLRSNGVMWAGGRQFLDMYEYLKVRDKLHAPSVLSKQCL